MIFDTHAHYDDGAFDDDREALLDSLPVNNITGIVNVASGMRSCKTSMELALSRDYIYAAVGVHPEEIEGLTDADLELIGRYCDGTVPEYAGAKDRIVAIGEIGLDYHYIDSSDEAAKARQKEIFIRQLGIAREKKKPVIIHSRDAAADTMDIMKAEDAGNIGGVVHCFSYSYEMAREYADMGLYIGVGGVLTFKNSKKLRECVQKLPMESLVLETDCPYLAPEPNRGKRNSSLNLIYVVRAIAGLRGISEEEVMEKTYANACRLYRLG